jgi:hypothetical protein
MDDEAPKDRLVAHMDDTFIVGIDGVGSSCGSGNFFNTNINKSRMPHLRKLSRRL